MAMNVLWNMMIKYYLYPIDKFYILDKNIFKLFFIDFIKLFIKILRNWQVFFAQLEFAELVFHRNHEGTKNCSKRSLRI
jgi:hypothetical protein